jgi:hypothetical protein
MKRLWIILPILLIMLASAPDALAQESCTETEQAFSIPESFPLNGGDWVMTYDAAEVAEPDLDADVDDDGFRMHTNVDLGGGHAVRFRIDFASPITITDIAADIVAEDGGAAIAFGFCYMADCDLEDFTSVGSGTQSAPFTYSYTTDQTNVYSLIVAMGCTGTGSDCELDNLTMAGLIEACLFRPVHEADQVDEASSGDLYVITTTAGARVYAIDDAVVDFVTHNADGYYVRLLINGATPIIYSKLSATFAEPGDTIEGGCVLGYVSQAGPEAQVDTGQFAYQHHANLGDWHDYSESLSTTPCGQEEANCINANPEMNTDEPGWLTRFNSGGSFNQGDDSVKSIVGAGMLYQPGFTVDFEATYFVTVVVALQPPATDGEIRVWFGGTETRLPIHTIGPEFVTITTLGFSTAFEGLSEFRIYNASSNSPTVRITFACLHLGDAIIAPPKCYFEDDGLVEDSFETESGATHGAGLIGLGQYSIPAGGVIRSAVNLAAFVDADTDFTLLIQGSGSGGAGELTASIVDSDTDDELAAIGEYAYLPLILSNQSKTFTVGESETLDGDLYIENTGSNTVIVEAVCLTSDAGVWPGYDNSDSGNHDLLPVNCQECAIPESFVDVVAWLNWLGCVLRYLIFCLLYTLVNNIWATASAILSGVKLFGLWLGRSISIIADWAWRAAGRLLASLISSAIPILNAIMAWILSLPFVRDILDAASIAAMWIDGVIQFIVGVINLFVSAVRFVGVMITLVGTVWTAFIDGLSGTSAIAVILPDCGDSGSPFYDVCLLLDILNFLVAEVPAIAILFGAVAVSILWATGRDIKDDIERVFES